MVTSLEDSFMKGKCESALKPNLELIEFLIIFHFFNTLP